ncbi:hypothetical protein KM043_004067 [Ampulex compressa]|nr:hypothetical protein KM043_004067 [Ampulex compressa]
MPCFPREREGRISAAVGSTIRSARSSIESAARATEGLSPPLYRLFLRARFDRRRFDARSTLASTRRNEAWRSHGRDIGVSLIEERADSDEEYLGTAFLPGASIASLRSTPIRGRRGRPSAEYKAPGQCRGGHTEAREEDEAKGHVVALTFGKTNFLVPSFGPIGAVLESRAAIRCARVEHRSFQERFVEDPARAEVGHPSSREGRPRLQSVYRFDYPGASADPPPPGGRAVWPSWRFTSSASSPRAVLPASPASAASPARSQSRQGRDPETRRLGSTCDPPQTERGGASLERGSSAAKKETPLAGHLGER